MRKFEKIGYVQFKRDVPEDFSEQTYLRIKIPQRATSKSAGYDLSAAIPVKIEPYETKLVPTGLKVQMEDNDVFLITVRSSIGIKRHMMLANNVGVIDADYYNNADNEGHIWIALTNLGDTTQEFEAGDRIAQGIFVGYKTLDEETVTDKVRESGIGSTGQ